MNKLVGAYSSSESDSEAEKTTKNEKPVQAALPKRKLPSIFDALASVPDSFEAVPE